MAVSAGHSKETRAGRQMGRGTERGEAPAPCGHGAKVEMRLVGAVEVALWGEPCEREGLWTGTAHETQGEWHVVG